MQITNRQGGSRPSTPSPKPPTAQPERIAVSTAPTHYSLPESKTPPVKTLKECTTFITGQPGIGKTSLCNQFDDPFFMFFEPGGKGLDLYQKPVPHWTAFKKYLDLIEASDRFQTIVIDTMDMAYRRCLQYKCKQKGVQSPSGQGDHGNIWGEIEEEFHSQLTRLTLAGRGVIFLAHVEVSKFQKPDGTTYNKLVPAISTQARRYWNQAGDLRAYYGYYGEKRYLTIQGSDSLEASTRLKYNFWVKGKAPLYPPEKTPAGYKGDVPLSESVRIHSISMGNSEEEGYENLVRAFNNEQASTGKPGGVTGISEAPAKRQARR